MKSTYRIIVIAVCILSFAVLAQADVILDNFNRSNGGVGSNWTVQTGSFAIDNNNLLTTEDMSLMTYNGLASNVASVDVFNAESSLYYSGIVLGYADLNTNIFIKIQNQSSPDSDFEYAAFYYGNNVNGNFFSITPFQTGRITASLIGNLATLDIDTNFDGSAEYTYSHSYSTEQIEALGNGVGLVGYGPSRMDNFGIPGNVPVPEPASLLLLGISIIGVSITARRKRN